MSEDDLRLLNRMVVERLKLYRKVKDLKNLSKFNLMDKVVFQHEGKNIVGIVLKLNRRSVTVKTTDGHQWTVAPVFLTRLR